MPTQQDEIINRLDVAFGGYRTLEAYLCTPETFPSKNTSISNFAVEFLEEYGISLYEQNYKLF